MGGAVFHRSRPYAPVARPARVESPPLPRGYGLLIGAGVSIGLWTGLIVGVARLLS